MTRKVCARFQLAHHSVERVFLNNNELRCCCRVLVALLNDDFGCAFQQTFSLIHFNTLMTSIYFSFQTQTKHLENSSHIWSNFSAFWCYPIISLATTLYLYINWFINFSTPHKTGHRFRTNNNLNKSKHLDDFTALDLSSEWNK